MNHFSRYLVIISIDALNSQDYEYIKTLPNFSTFFKEGSVIKEVESIYPTVTYTCHTSIITGTYPNKHKIFCNEKINPNNPLNQEWYWYEKDIKVPTLFDYVKKEGLTSASVLWPVMAGGPVDYNCPEIWSVSGESYMKLYWKYASRNILPTIFKHSFKLKGKQQPYLDNFIEGISKDILRRKKPNLTCIHFIGLDKTRHIYGLHTDESLKALKLIDGRIGNIINIIKKLGIYENTTFVLLGDHGTNDYHNVIEINSLFKKEDLINVDSKNNITTWEAYSSSCGGSVQIHISDTVNIATKEKIKSVLNDFVNTNDCINKIYTKEKVQKLYNLDGDFEYMLEAKDGYIFRNSISDDIIKQSHNIDNNKKGDHGFEPIHKNMKTILLAKGNKIKGNIEIEKASLVDEGPTFAKILDIDMLKVDGKVITDILK
jgi:predicted AlkP superfamily pyrophosphatase or phosphodiesterase